jgi:hypothetical protein
MFCDTDSEELLTLVSKAGGIGCLLQDTVHLTTTVVLPLIQRQMQARNQLHIQIENLRASWRVLITATYESPSHFSVDSS